MSATALPQDIGSAKAALKDLLTGPAYEAALAETVRRFGDGLPLPALESVSTTLKATDQAYPSCEMVGDVTATAEESTADECEHRIELWFFVNGDDEETIEKQVERYVYAARRMLTGRVLGPSVPSAPIRIGKAEFSPVGRASKARGAFLKIGVLEVFVGTLED